MGMRNAAHTINAGRWLTEAERNPPYLTMRHTLADCVDLFQRDPDLRLLPILDEAMLPIGAVFEKDVRRLLLNPFGHALLKNPSVNADLKSHLRQCPVHELTDDISTLVRHYRAANGREGMVLTAGGRLSATLTNRRLLLLAADEEHRQSVARVERAQRIEQAGGRFEMQAASLAAQMVQLANSVQRLAEATVDRATIAGNRAAAVATAAVQTRDNMGTVAHRGKSLAQAFGGIEQSLKASRTTVEATADRVSQGNRRAQALLQNAQSIDAVMGLVNDIASTVNLLSLNATIEAARAGEAGRGFAVVASEIRSLSDQTQEATQRITSEVAAVREGVATVAGDYVLMEEAITSVADRSSEIDQAVSREIDTTRLIATSVTEASEASKLIEESVSAIVQSVRSASSAARELDTMANQLRSGATALSGEVAAFLDELRAA